MRFTNIALALALTGAAATTANAARDTIQIAGSSTVLPYASIVAEEFGNTFRSSKPGCRFWRFFRWFKTVL